MSDYATKYWSEIRYKLHAAKDAVLQMSRQVGPGSKHMQTNLGADGWTDGIDGWRGMGGSCIKYAYLCIVIFFG